jgi:glutathione peroxidase
MRTNVDVQFPTMKILLATFSLGACTVLLGGLAPAVVTMKERPMSLHDFTVDSIDHQAQPLAAYKGKVALVVNTASECGFTPQYKDLEALYQRYKDRGLVVLGFPSNDFGGQEPGSEAEIKKFCSLKYRVTFPMFAKVKTKGADRSAVYEFLSAAQGEPKWNFHKYLVGKDGKVIAGYPSKVAPDSPELAGAIEAALLVSRQGGRP